MGKGEPKEGGEQPWNAETVAEAAAEAKFHVEFEESRLEGQFQRAGWLVALDGVLLGLAGSQAHEVLSHASELGNTGRWIAAIALLITVMGVLCSAVLSLFAVSKKRSWAWSLEEIDDLAEEKTVQKDRAEVQGTFLRGLIERVRETRCGYVRVRRWLLAAYTSLGIALVSVSIFVGVYSVRTIQNPSPCPHRTARVAEAPRSHWVSPGTGAPRFGLLVALGGTRGVPVDSPFPKPKGGPCKG